METQNVEPSSVNNPHLTLDQVRERVLTLVEKGHSDAYQIGQLYNYVVDSNLAQASGFADAPDFFKQRVVVLSQPTLSMYGAIARRFSEAASVKHGVSRLYTLLTYAKHAKVEVDGNEPGPTPILVPQADGTLATRPFAECSRDELQQAVKGQRDGASPIPDEVSAHIRSLQERLDRYLPQKHGIRVEARRSGSELRMSLRNVPAAQVERLVAVLVGPQTQEPSGAAQPAAAPQVPRPVELGQALVQVVAPQPPAAPSAPGLAPTQQPQQGAMPEPQEGTPPLLANPPGMPRNGRAGLLGMLREAFQPTPRTRV